MALVTCKTCGCKFGRQAKFCPYCGAAHKKKIFKGVCVVVFLAIVAIAAIEGHIDASKDTSRQETPKKEAPKKEAPKQKCDNSVLAFVMVNQFVQDRLKAPSTASFPSYSDAGVFVKSVEKAGKCSYYIDSYVDSQNSFGAMIRTRFHAEFKNKIDTDMWRLASLRFID